MSSNSGFERRSYSSEAVVLARKNYSEADRILVVYSKDYGRISLLARGVRRLTSRKRGHIEVFNHIKFSAASGHGIDVITEAQVIDDFNEVKKNLKKVSVAYFFMEVIGKLTKNEKNQRLFDLLLSNLRMLKDELHLKKLRADFTKDALIATGFWSKEKEMLDPDQMLEEVVEKRIASIRVGRRLNS